VGDVEMQLARLKVVKLKVVNPNKGNMMDE